MCYFQKKKLLQKLKVWIALDDENDFGLELEKEYGMKTPMDDGSAIIPNIISFVMDIVSSVVEQIKKLMSPQ